MATIDQLFIEQVRKIEGAVESTPGPYSQQREQHLQAFRAVFLDDDVHTREMSIFDKVREFLTNVPETWIHALQISDNEGEPRRLDFYIRPKPLPHAFSQDEGEGKHIEKADDEPPVQTEPDGFHLYIMELRNQRMPKYLIRNLDEFGERRPLPSYFYNTDMTLHYPSITEIRNFLEFYQTHNVDVKYTGLPNQYTWSHIRIAQRIEHIITFLNPTGSPYTELNRRIMRESILKFFTDGEIEATETEFLAIIHFLSDPIIYPHFKVYNSDPIEVYGWEYQNKSPGGMTYEEYLEHVQNTSQYFITPPLSPVATTSTKNLFACFFPWFCS